MSGLTEEQARTKWCPHVRISDLIVAKGEVAFATTANRSDDENFPDDRCVASDCMMWRWSARDALPGETRLETALRDDPPSRGFCGLAGAPT